MRDTVELVRYDAILDAAEFDGDLFDARIDAAMRAAKGGV
jgi:hypothetical protein